MYNAQCAILRLFGQLLLDAEDTVQTEHLASSVDEILDILRNTCEPEVSDGEKIRKA